MSGINVFKKKKYFEDMFQCVSMSKKTVPGNKKEYLYNHIVIDGKKIIGSNGAVLIVFENESLDIENGVYEVSFFSSTQMVLTKSKIQYPDWEKVIPDNKKFIMTTDCINSSLAINISKVRKAVPCHLNFEFLTFLELNDFEVFIKSENSTMDPVLFESEDKKIKVVVMPIIKVQGN